MSPYRFAPTLGAALDPQQPLRRDDPHEVRQVLAAGQRPRLHADQGELLQPLLRPHHGLGAGADAGGGFVMAEVGRCRDGALRGVQATLTAIDCDGRLSVLLPLFGGARATVPQADVARA
jgi:hypothetical protein